MLPVLIAVNFYISGLLATFVLLRKFFPGPRTQDKTLPLLWPLFLPYAAIILPIALVLKGLDKLADLIDAAGAPEEPEPEWCPEEELPLIPATDALTAGRELRRYIRETDPETVAEIRVSPSILRALRKLPETLSCSGECNKSGNDLWTYEGFRITRDPSLTDYDWYTVQKPDSPAGCEKDLQTTGKEGKQA